MKIPLEPPKQSELLRKISGSNPERILELITKGISPETIGRYFHWDELRHKQTPPGISHEEWWLSIKIARSAIKKSLVLKDQYGKSFGLAMTEGLLRKLHEIDRDAGGAIRMDAPIVNDEHRERYLIKSLFEEAITSSQLEGASTTTREAKRMLRTRRRPRDRSEQMILNNYHAMQFVRENKKEPLSREFLLELHEIVTDNTLDKPDASGRWRKASEDIIVSDNRDGTVLYRPPSAELIPERMQNLFDFANADQTSAFLHPVIRAVILHFMLSFEHPFVDGNGRTARALFYWFLIRSGYWLVEFLSISKVIKEAPGQYARSFLFVETDENDLTYFLHHQFDVIIKSISSLYDYFTRKAEELRQTEKLLRGPIQRVLNHRQVGLITHALKHPNHLYDIQSHRTSNGVTYQTSRNDLLGLEDIGLLTKFKRGRAFVFQSPTDISKRITEINKELSSK